MASVSDYVRIKSIRKYATLVYSGQADDKRIIHNGKIYTETDFNAAFPLPLVIGAKENCDRTKLWMSS